MVLVVVLGFIVWIYFWINEMFLVCIIEWLSFGIILLGLSDLRW